MKAIECAPRGPDPLATGPEVEHDTYLSALERAHTQFHAACADAGRMLHDPCDPFSELAARHARLAREFVDGQRAILRRRASTIASVRALVDELGSGSVESASVATSERQVMSSDVAAALEPAAAEYELRSLLDRWWHREDGVALAVSAGELAADEMWIEFGLTDTGNMGVPSIPITPPDPRSTPLSEMPPDVAALVSAHDAGALSTLLSGLLKTLDARPVAVGEPVDTVPPPGPAPSVFGAPPGRMSFLADPHEPEGSAMRQPREAGSAGRRDSHVWGSPNRAPTSRADLAFDGRSTRSEQIVVSSEEAQSMPSADGEAFARFWGQGDAASGGGARRSFAFHLLAPMCSVVATLAVVLAWVG